MKSETQTRPLDLTSSIIAYESGELSDDEIVQLFQHLVDTGLAWQLQGHYGRVARNLISGGLVKYRGAYRRGLVEGKEKIV